MEIPESTPLSPSPAPQTRRPEAPEDQLVPHDPDWIDAGESVALVAIVIDDVGYREGLALELASLGLPLTFALLPHQRHTRSLAERLQASGHEVILHLPMEPRAYPARDPGEGAVGAGMPSGAIAGEISRALDEIPGAVGVSNHMGSRATADPVVMEAVLAVVRSRGLYFLDSRTTPERVVLQIARKMGVPALERTVFLDARRDESYIESQIQSLLREARAKGSAVAIGHLYPATVEVLKRSADLLRGEDIRLVPASELVGFEGGGSG